MWSAVLANSGASTATFSDGQIVFIDNLPANNISYSNPNVTNPSGVTGTINCGLSSNDLTCSASGTVTIAAGGSVHVEVSATPSAIGVFANPRVGGSCSVDPNNNLTESNEANNTCSNSVTVGHADLTATITNNVGGIVSVNVPWTWTVHIANTGDAVANFENSPTILRDEAPNTIGGGSISYLGSGSLEVKNAVNITNFANVSCSVGPDNLVTANTILICTAPGTLIIGPGGSNCIGSRERICGWDNN